MFVITNHATIRNMEVAELQAAGEESLFLRENQSIGQERVMTVVCPRVSFY